MSAKSSEDLLHASQGSWKRKCLKCLFLLKSFVFKVTYVTHSLTELSKTGKVGNSFRFSVVSGYTVRFYGITQC